MLICVHGEIGIVYRKRKEDERGTVGEMLMFSHHFILNHSQDDSDDDGDGIHDDDEDDDDSFQSCYTLNILNHLLRQTLLSDPDHQHPTTFIYMKDILK